MLRPVLTCLLLLSLCSAAAAAAKGTGGLLKYGMELSAAETELAEPGWQVAYRIDTASTNEIAALWQGSVYYLARFYDGRCVALEKRAQVSRADVDALVALYRETYGDTPEASRGRDGQVVFARWSRAEREVSIYAIRGTDGSYKLFYEESDPVVRSEARRTQEREVAAMPRETDPLTGRIRVNPLGAAALGPDDPNAPEPDPEDAGEEPDDPDAEAAEPDTDAEKDAGDSDKDADEDSEPRRPRRTSPDEW